MKKILVIVVLMIGFLMILEGLGYFLKVERVVVNGEELEREFDIWSGYGVDMDGKQDGSQKVKYQV